MWTAAVALHHLLLRGDTRVRQADKQSQNTCSPKSLIVCQRISKVGNTMPSLVDYPCQQVHVSLCDTLGRTKGTKFL